MTVALRRFVFHLVSLSLLGLGFAQASFGGTIDTRSLMALEAGDAARERVLELLDREDVASRLAELGVEPTLVQARVAAMSDAEIAAFGERLDAGMAGGDAIAVIGVVFLVLLILELVGVTNVFTKI